MPIITETDLYTNNSTIATTTTAYPTSLLVQLALPVIAVWTAAKAKRNRKRS